MKTTTVLSALASALVARANCIKLGNTEWENNHSATIDQLARDFLPSGSGFDSGTKVNLDQSNGETRIVLTTSYHHMNEGGMYDGWTDHTVTIRPCLLHEFTLTISGRDRNQFKDYAYEVFNSSLKEQIVLFPDGGIKAKRWVNDDGTQRVSQAQDQASQMLRGDSVCDTGE